MLKSDLVLEQLEQGLWGLLWTAKVKIIFVHLNSCSKRLGKLYAGLGGQTQGVLSPSTEVVGGTRFALMVIGPVAGDQECSSLEGNLPTTALKLSLTADCGPTPGSGSQECSNLSNSVW